MNDPALEARLVEWAAKGGLPTDALDAPVAWPLLRRATGAFDLFLRTRRRAWRGTRRDAALLRVHRAEQARLLREALSSVLVRLPAEGPWLGVAGLALAPPRWEAWRVRAQRELALAHAAGVGAPRELLAATLWHPSLLGVDGALALARAALALDPGPAGLLALARARLAAGAPDAALVAIDRARSEVVPCSSEERLADGLERCRVVALDRRGDHAALRASLRRLPGLTRGLAGGDPALTSTRIARRLLAR